MGITAQTDDELFDGGSPLAFQKAVTFALAYATVALLIATLASLIPFAPLALIAAPIGEIREL